MVLVDDQLGAVLMDADLINEAKNRIVCDNNQVLQNPNVAHAPCVNASANLVRTEAGPPAALAEANTAFDLGGAVHDNYAAFQAGFDLTNLIGRVVDGGSTKALAQTVRWCFSGSACPYANAFWNGSQMYYGTNYATADDVVGHEMTHGVTERNSDLFYWSQSGAMNESISDIMGEIIDHRNVRPGRLADGLAAGRGPARSGRSATSRTRPSSSDPDQTVEPALRQGELLRLPGLGRRALQLAVSATRRSTWPPRAAPSTGRPSPASTPVTPSSRGPRSSGCWSTSRSPRAATTPTRPPCSSSRCQALIGTGVMNAANCTAVHQATLATELRNTPVNNPQPADAAVDAARQARPRVLFDSETGTPATKFTAGAGWSRNGVPGWGQVAHTNPAAWSAFEAAPSSSELADRRGADRAPGRAGVVPVLPALAAAPVHRRAASSTTPAPWRSTAADAAALPWVNGPTQTINGTGNPANGRLGFGGDSRGYVASRVDLSSFAGQSVTPRFTVQQQQQRPDLHRLVRRRRPASTPVTCRR